MNKDADCLSRLPLDIEHYQKLCMKEVTPDAFKAILAGVETKRSGDETWKLKINSLQIDIESEFTPSFETIGNIEKLKAEQQKDEDISRFMECMKEKSDLKIDPADSDWLKVFKRSSKKLKLNKEGILVKESEGSARVVLPKSMRELIYEHLHVDMGHIGAEKMWELAKKRVFWPRMLEDIESFVAEKCKCIARRRPHQQRKAPLQNITTYAPMELVHVDYVHLERGVGGMEYLLVIIDHFTKFAQAYPTPNKSSLTAAKRLYGDFMLRFGMPTNIISDQGGEFESEVMQHLHKICGVNKIRTTPYHPRTNGACERMNKTLLKMLRSLPENMRTRWPESVNKMMYA